MPTYTQANRHLEVRTPLGQDVLLLTDLTGTEGLSQLFHFRLGMLAENTESVPYEQVLGQPVLVSLTLSATKKRFFSGIVSSLSQGQRDTTFTTYHAEVVPHVWLLTQRSQSRIFQQQSVPDILKKVFEGFEVSYEIYGDFAPRDYCVQYRETDFAFASRLMEEEGIYYFFKHTAAGHKMVLANTPASHPDLPDLSKIVYEGRPGTTRSRCRVTEWEKVQQLRPSKVTLRDHCFELPHKHLQASRNTLETVEVGKVAHKLKLGPTEPCEVYEVPGRYAQRFDGVDPGGNPRPADLQKIFQDNTRMADIRVQQETLPGVVIHGAGYCRQFCSGFKFTLHRHYNADGGYVITSVNHEASTMGDYRTSNGSSSNIVYTNRFTCIPVGLPYRPERKTPRPVVDGSQSAVVVGPPGEEIFTDKYGRVKVQFHWDRQGKNDSNSSCWIRVAQLWAGKHWGSSFVPRIGQEVIVDFLEGDPDNPIIVGSVYNADQMPPYLGQGPDPKHPHDPRISGIKTNSTPGGRGYNELRFDDSKGKEQLFLHAERDQDVRINHDRNEWVGNDSHLIVKHDQLEKIEGDFHRQIKGDQSEKVDGTVSLTVGADLQLKVSKHYAVEASSEIHLKSGMNLVLEATGLLTLKVGANFLTLSPAGIALNGVPFLLNNGGVPGSGSGCSPEKPADPHEADTALSGDKSNPDKQTPEKPLSFIMPKSLAPSSPLKNPSQAVQALKTAAKTGTPLIQICPKLKK